MGQNSKLLNLTTSNLKQTKTFYQNKRIFHKSNRSGSRTSMTPKTEKNVAELNGYQSLNSR